MQVYCDMEGTNCGGEGGWTSVEYVNMSQRCPYVQAPCCTHPNIQWFNNTLNETTTEDIELRLCVDQHVIRERLSSSSDRIACILAIK